MMLAAESFTTASCKLRRLSRSPASLRASKEESRPAFYEYKDDCFGFMSFVAGAGTRDVLCAGLFVGLSLDGAFFTS